MNVDQLRKAYIDFFVEKQHKHVASAPLVPPDDPTLLFTTAGMVQFKSLYAGSTALPYPRACTVQKCLRAGGKGSDLENVGRTLRHHTFFEMLGNFSFGDYFKREALEWAWEFCTQVLKLDKSRLYASVFQDDDEAWDIWTKELGMPEDHMVRLGVKDNFWGPAGDTGACGPCSEIYYDRGEQFGEGLTFQHATINDDDPGSRYLEFWNCVFPQFDQQKDGTRLSLKNRGVDTGMGLERLACIVQEKNSPYEIDTMMPIVDAVCSLLHLQSYHNSPLETRQSVNVIADHMRALTFVLSEGILPSNEGRGYVMRRLLRRASRYARKVGQEQPFMFRLVDTVVEVMGGAYPEIKGNVDIVKRVIRQEESSYSETLGSGLQKLESLLAGRAGTNVSAAETTGGLSGSEVFQLTATYGFPLDDILEITRERNIPVNLEEYQEHVSRHRDESRKGAKGTRFEGIYERLKEIYQEHGKTQFIGYPSDIQDLEEELGLGAGSDPFEILQNLTNKIADLGLGKKDTYRKNYRGEFGEDPEDDGFDEEEGDEEDDDDDGIEFDINEEYPVVEASGLTILAMFKGDQPVSRAGQGDEVAVILDSTPFYAESGGQVGDTGFLQTDNGRIRVTDTQKTGEDVFVHYGEVQIGELHEGDDATAEIDADRRWAIMRNHTATHLLQGALKRVVGKHIAQQGSYVGPDYLRFDFTNPEAVTQEQLAEIERLVNDQILRNIVVDTRTMSLEEARQTGAIAPFGEKYGSQVRVVDVPDWDIEFCGGTHMLLTGGIGSFVITGESAIAAGVRRLEAVTGEGAVRVVQAERLLLKHLAEELSVPRERVPERVNALLEELKNTRKQVAQLRAKASASEVGSLLDAATETNGVKIVAHRFEGFGAQEMREAYDALKSKRQTGLAVVLASAVDGKVTLIVGGTPDVVERGISAGDIVKQIAPIVGGSGGGKKDMAQAGGKNPEKITEALEAATKLIREKLG